MKIIDYHPFPKFSDHIKEYLSENSLKEDEFCKKNKIHGKILKKWIIGTDIPKPEEFDRIMKIMNIEYISPPREIGKDPRWLLPKECGYCKEKKIFARNSECCSKECLSKYKFRDHQYIRYPKICGNCNEKFDSTVKSTKYCSLKCGNESKQIDQFCIFCKNKMKHRRTSTNFCSEECRENEFKTNSSPIGSTVKKNGYVRIKTEEGWFWEHRVVKEKQLGRKLYSHESIHHLNGQRDDNRIENLEIWIVSQVAGQRVCDKLNWLIDMYRLYNGKENL